MRIAVLQHIVPLAFLVLIVIPPPAWADGVETLLQRGDSAQTAKNPRAALRFYQQAARLDGANPDVLWRISKVYTDLAIGSKTETTAIQQTDRAIASARRAVSVGPRHAMAHAVLAVAYGQKAVYVPNTEKMELSKLLHAHARTALEIDGANTVAMLVLGIWHREVASLNWVVRMLLKAVYDDVPEASLEQSRQLLRRAVELQPKQIMPRIELAKTLLALDEEDAAGHQLRMAISLPLWDVHDTRRLDEARRLLKDIS